MPIKSIQINEPGQSGIEPSIIRLETDDSVSTVTAAGYLTDAVKKGLLVLKESDMLLIQTQESASAAKEVGWYNVQKSGDDWNVIPPNTPGEVVLPTVANRIAHFTNADGTLSSDAADVVNIGDLTLGADGKEGLLNLFPSSASSGKLIVKPLDNGSDVDVTISNASHGQASVYSIPDGGSATANFIISEWTGTQHINSGHLQVDAGNISAGSQGTQGIFVSYPSTANTGLLRLQAFDNSADAQITIINDDHPSSANYFIPYGGVTTSRFLIDNFDGIQDIETGSLQTDNGDFIAGSDGNEGKFVSHPPSSSNGTLELQASDLGTDSRAVISNNAIGQDTTYSIPDAEEATASILIDRGSSNNRNWKQFVGIDSFMLNTAGTWTITRTVGGIIVLRHAQADDTSILVFDVSPMYRDVTDKGIRLTSFDVIFFNEIAGLNAHSVELYEVVYGGASVSATSLSLGASGALPTGTFGSHQVFSVALNSPAFLNESQANYIIELTVDTASTSEYDLYGFNLNFDETIG